MDDLFKIRALLNVVASEGGGTVTLSGETAGLVGNALWELDRLRARVAELAATPPIEVLLSSLDKSIVQREATPGRPEDGPYPATVGECADEIVDWLSRAEAYAGGLTTAVASRLAPGEVHMEWGVDRPEFGDTWPAGNEHHAQEIARAYISMPVTVVSREVRTGPWVATPSVPSGEEK